jgi:hypothetical protein
VFQNPARRKSPYRCVPPVSRGPFGPPKFETPRVGGWRAHEKTPNSRKFQVDNPGVQCLMSIAVWVTKQSCICRVPRRHSAKAGPSLPHAPLNEE